MLKVSDCDHSVVGCAVSITSLTPSLKKDITFFPTFLLDEKRSGLIFKLSFVENIVLKGQIPHHEQLLLWSHYFQNSSMPEASESICRGKKLRFQKTFCQDISAEIITAITTLDILTIIKTPSHIQHI